MASYCQNMISILIPIYNYDITSLVFELKKQCEDLKIVFEIVCYDDGSELEYKDLNRIISQEFGISYIELSENKGRSKIRNLLARNARYDSLIFLDCDSEVITKDYIKKYVEKISKTKIVFGGRLYYAYPPDNIEHNLHWNFGKKRESISLTKRKNHPYRSFQTNNFMAPRNILLKFPFDEKILNYGYEDLVFAEALKNERIPIDHIENPLIHKGLESNKDFLQKTKLATENLAILYHQGQLNDTRMIQFHEKIKKIGFNSFLHKIVERKKDYILKNLNSKNPNLYLFDFYRYYLFSLKLNDLEASSS